MPATERSNLSENDEQDTPPLFEDERVAMLICSYLDGELAGEDEEEFARLMSDTAFARRVRELEKIEDRLRDVGRDVLSEAVPASLLDIVSAR